MKDLRPWCVYAIVKREIREQIFSRKFLFMTLSFPIIILIVIGVQSFISSMQRGETSQVTVFAETEALANALRRQFAEGELADPALYHFDFQIGGPEQLEQWIDSRRPELLSGEISGLLFVPDSAREDKQLFYYSSNPSNQALLSRLRGEVDSMLLADYFRVRGLDASALSYLDDKVSISPIRVTESGTAREGFGKMALAFVFTFLLYINLLTMGPTVMGVVNEEKSNRVVEMLLSSVSARELMSGKIMGTAIAGLAQMGVWLLPILVVLSGALPGLVLMNLNIELDFLLLAYFLFSYVIGLLTFLSIFAAFGAMFDNPQEAQSSMFPVMMLVILPFIVALTILNNPATLLAEIASVLPFFTLMVMPARMALVDVPLWHLALALLVNLATLYLALSLSGKIYRFTILMTGKRPSWKEVWKWLKYA